MVDSAHASEDEMEDGASEDHSTVIVRTLRDIRQGEQLFVEYDAFAHEKHYTERRKVLKRWLVTDCLCKRCVREESEELEKGGVGGRLDGEDEQSADESRAWDVGERVELPEYRV